MAPANSLKDLIRTALQLLPKLLLVFMIGFYGFQSSKVWAAQSLEKPPQRIVSCSLATDELLVALLKPESYNRIVALSSLADHPVYSNLKILPTHLVQSKVEHRGNPVNAPVCSENIEALLGLKPDLVLLAAYSSPLLERQLSMAKIATFTAVSPRTLDDIGSTIKALGVALREVPSSDRLFKDFTDERTRIKKIPVPPALSKRRIIHVFGDGAVSGSQTLFDSLATELAITNQAAVQGLKGWSKHSVETLLALNPEIIITGRTDQESPLQVTDRLKKIPGFGYLPALKAAQGAGAVVALSERELGSVSHHILTGLATLKQALISRENQLGTPSQR